MSKIGLVAEGGGMKCAYSAGVLDAFLDHNISFDYCIGVSAGAANEASYLAGQRGRNLRFYTEHIADPEYFGAKSFLKTGNLFGLQHIYGTLSNSDGIDALDFPAMQANPAEYYVVATHAETGKPVYFSVDEMMQDDYRHIMASCAIPAVCRPVEINGQHYYDGGVSDAIPVRRAMRDGCDKIVVILSKERDYVKAPEKHRPTYSVLCGKYPYVVRALNNRHRMYKRCQDDLYRLEQAGRAFVFAPDTPLKRGTYSMDCEVEQKLYDLGLQDAARYAEQLKAFMGKAAC